METFIETRKNKDVILATLMDLIRNGIGTMYYTYTDHLGSIWKLVNQNGADVRTYGYDAWGRRRNPTGFDYGNVTNYNASGLPLLTRGYTAHEHIDELGIINMNSRMYDPLIAQFLSVDYLATNYPDYTPFAYAMNNPLKYTDPTGNFPEDPQGDDELVRSSQVTDFSYGAMKNRDQANAFNKATTRLNTTGGKLTSNANGSFSVTNQMWAGSGSHMAYKGSVTMNYGGGGQSAGGGSGSMWDEGGSGPPVKADASYSYRTNAVGFGIQKVLDFDFRLKSREVSYSSWSGRRTDDKLISGVALDVGVGFKAFANQYDDGRKSVTLGASIMGFGGDIEFNRLSIMNYNFGFGTGFYAGFPVVNVHSLDFFLGLYKR